MSISPSGLQITVKRCGNVLSISQTDNMPFDPEFLNNLTKDLKYQHVEQLHGPAQRNPITGQRQYFKTTEYKLFRYENGKIILPSGYLARMTFKLKKLGCVTSFVEASPPRKRPDCYMPEWDNLTDRIEFRARQEECLKLISKSRCGIIKAVTGFGKAQPVDEKVLTPTGWARMGELRVGDYVIGANGHPTAVCGVYPQGKKSVVTVAFTDGSKVDCCEEHLWNVQTKAHKHRGKKFQTRPIGELVGDLKNKQGETKWFIPVTQPVHFNATPVPVDPYLLGVFLGDGGLTSGGVRFSSADAEIIENVRSVVEPEGLKVRHVAAYDYQISQVVRGNRARRNSLTEKLRSLNVMRKSKDKHIPDIYKYNTVEVRLAVLRGLMDTDGTVRKRSYHVEFGAVASEQLANDVCEIVRSLGGVTRVKPQKYASRPGQTYYRVSVNLPMNPFLLARKAKLWRPTTKQGRTKGILKIIKNAVPRECVCISVAAADGLYITKDYTVTHNTTMIGALALLFPKAKIHVVTKSVDVAERIVKSLRRFIPKVGFVGDGSRHWERVTVITAGSLAHSDGDADFLFCDEVHQLATINFSSQLAQKYRHSRNFGLSATPYARMDNAHAVLEPLFGPMIFELNYQQAVELGLVVPIRVRWLPIRMAFNPVERFSNRVAKKRHGVWTNPDRNRMIADAVREYPETHQILILVETIEHAVNLGALLPEYTLVYGAMFTNDCNAYKKRGLLPADYKPISDYDKHKLRDQFEKGELKRVIATDVWSTGVDFEQLNVLVRADDRDSDIIDVQGPGRVSRIYVSPDGAKKEFGEVIDCMDTWDTTFYRKSMGRRNSYKLLGWEQNWNDAQRSWRDE